ncbi:hypothetical protein ElyMa_003550000 [Elysia marginata]|uniref:Uncharacterized protein n=1 Tax=Elysia marginata TaxID=1093978 RepID=A0AAV4EL62_9GAST|nr:hypothetical protein ElyMa_003550000 [Elysia marginata]
MGELLDTRELLNCFVFPVSAQLGTSFLQDAKNAASKRISRDERCPVPCVTCWAGRDATSPRERENRAARCEWTLIILSILMDVYEDCACLGVPPSPDQDNVGHSPLFIVTW